jgi:hypothetical protein
LLKVEVFCAIFNAPSELALKYIALCLFQFCSQLFYDKANIHKALQGW